jgi:uncharacterized protein HemY
MKLAIHPSIPCTRIKQIHLAAQQNVALINLQEELTAKIKECDQLSERVREMEEESAGCKSPPAELNRAASGYVCQACKDGNLADLQTALKREQTASEKFQEQLREANAKVAQLQVRSSQRLGLPLCALREPA